MRMIGGLTDGTRTAKAYDNAQNFNKNDDWPSQLMAA
jgi:hypothetical protein